MTTEIFGFLPALIHGRIPSTAGPYGSERMPFRLGFGILEIATEPLKGEGIFKYANFSPFSWWEGVGDKKEFPIQSN